MDYAERIESFEEFKLRFNGIYAPCQQMQKELRARSSLPEEIMNLIKLGISVGTKHPGVIQSDVRKCLDSGASAEDVLSVVDSAVGTLSIPELSDAYRYVTEAINAHGS